MQTQEQAQDATGPGLLCLNPGLPLMWRAAGRLQIGLDPARGIVLDGLSEGDEHIVSVLVDGTTESDLRLRARRVGLGARHLDELLEALAPVLLRRPLLGFAGRELPALAAHYAQDAPRLLAARARRTVVVHGLGAVGLGIALDLARAGVGVLRLDDPGTVRPEDCHAGGYRARHLGLPRSSAARELIDGLAPGPRLEIGGHGPDPDLAVLVGSPMVPATAGHGWLSADVAHLAVSTAGAGATVGPLVEPGVTGCLRCADLHRTDRDPEWPVVAAQVRHPPRRIVPAGAVLCGLATSLAAHQAVTWLDGVHLPRSHGTALEVGIADAVPVPRRWPAHPACGCHSATLWSRTGRQWTMTG